MNKILSVIFLLTYTFSFTQYTKKVKTTQTIVQQRTIYLNSGTRSSVDGKSRVVIPFDLPQNTVEWYYSFSTSEGVNGTKNLNLALQLSSLLIDKTGTSAKLMNQVKVPGGFSNIDVYLLNAENQNAFENKWDNNGGTFYFITEGTVKNTKQAVVKVDDVKSGRWYLGLKNPSSLDGVHIFIEIIAIIENDIFVDEWTNENENKLTSKCLANFNTESPEKNKVCDCVTSKITNQYLPSLWIKQTTYSQQKIINPILESCYIETGNLALKNAEIEYENQTKYKSLIERADILSKGKNLEEAIKLYTDASLLIPYENYPKEQITNLNKIIELNKIEQAILDSKIKSTYKLVREAYAASDLGDYSDARTKINSAIELIIVDNKLVESFGYESINIYYNSAAWWSILLKEIDVAGDFIKKGLTFDSQNMYVREKLALFHLLKENYSEAEKAFLYFGRKEKFSNGAKWVDVIEADLKLLENKGMGNPDFEKIKSLLKIK